MTETPESSEITEETKAKALLVADRLRRQNAALTAIYATLAEHRCTLHVKRIEAWAGAQYLGPTVELSALAVD